MFLGAKCRSAVRMQSAQLSMQRAVLAHCTVCTIDYIKGCEVSRPSSHSLIHNGGFTCGHYGITGCGVFKAGIQNWKGFA